MKAEWYEAQAKRLRDEGEKVTIYPTIYRTQEASHDVRYSSKD